MKFLKMALCLFTLLSSAYAKEYTLVDLGLFETDRSLAIAINEKDQVLGYFWIKDVDSRLEYRHIFLWDEINKLTILDLPQTYGDLRLNNNGQIAGRLWLRYDYSLPFLWDKELGLTVFPLPIDFNGIAGFNDKEQVLVNTDEGQMVLFDHNKEINLTMLFNEQVPGYWNASQAEALNNHGHVVICARDIERNPTFFLWKDGVFKMLLPELQLTADELSHIYGIHATLDDDGNILIVIRSLVSFEYFIDKSGNSTPCARCSYIINGFPVELGCLQGEFTQNQFTTGPAIKDLIKEPFPYRKISWKLDTYSQNSKGYFVGECNTVYSAKHAFLAIPSK